jgi:hypothetical protein
MIKERILNLEGKRKRQDKFGPIRIVFGKKWQFFFSKREREDKKCQGEVSQSKERGEKDRWKVDERGEG